MVNAKFGARALLTYVTYVLRTVLSESENMKVFDGFIFDLAALPTPPSSPLQEAKRQKAGEALPSAFITAAAPPLLQLTAHQQPEAQEHGERLSVKKNMSLLEWARLTPVYATLKAALKDMHYKEVEAAGFNRCCFLYSYLLSKGDMKAEEQKTKYAAARVHSMT